MLEGYNIIPHSKSLLTIRKKFKSCTENKEKIQSQGKMKHQSSGGVTFIAHQEPK